MIRLDKYLSNMTGESRSIIKSEIKKGNVIVNGSTVLKAENKIDEIKDEVIYRVSQLPIQNMHIICLISLPVVLVQLQIIPVKQ